MKKLTLFIFISLIFFVLISCAITKDTTPPTFIGEPEILDARAFNLRNAGDEIIIRFEVEDNSAIKDIYLYTSLNVNEPYMTIVNNYGKNHYKGDVRVRLPFSFSTYNFVIRAVDYEGNRITRNIRGDFSVTDNTPPRVFREGEFSPVYEKIEGNLYKFKYFFEEIGSGVRNINITFNQNRTFTITNKYTSEGDIDERIHNYYFIEDLGWKQQGYIVFYERVNLENNNIVVSISDNSGKLASANFVKNIKSENPDSFPVLTVNYKPFYVLDSVTKETELITFSIRAYDFESNISKVEVYENNSKRTKNFTPSEPEIEFEFSVGIKTEIDTINFRVIAYNTNGNIDEKDFTIRILESQKPTVNLSITKLTDAEGNSIDPAENIIGNYLFVDEGYELEIQIEARDNIGLKNVNLLFTKDNLTTTLFSVNTEENLRNFSKIVNWTINDKGIYKLEANAKNIGDIVSKKTLPFDIVASDEDYVLSDMRIEVNFLYNEEEINEEIEYRIVDGEKVFTVAKGTQMTFITEIFSVFGNIAKINFILDDEKLPGQVYQDQTGNRREYFLINPVTAEKEDDEEKRYELRVKVEDAIGITTIIDDVYYIVVKDTIEEAYGSDSSIRVDNRAPNTGNSINLNYEIEDFFGIKSYNVVLYEVSEGATRTRIGERPLISQHMGGIKSTEGNRDWTPFRTTDFIFVLQVENNLGIITESETRLIEVDRILIDILHPRTSEIVRRRSQRFIDFRIDTSGGSDLKVYVGEINENNLIIERFVDNNKNEPSRYDFFIDLNMANENDEYVFKDPGEYTVIFEASYRGKKSMTTRTINIRDDSDPIIIKDKIEIISLGIASLVSSAGWNISGNNVIGVYEDVELDSDKYFIPINYNGINTTSIDSKIVFIDYVPFDEANIILNGIKTPMRFIGEETIETGPNQGKKELYYELSNPISANDVQIGRNDFKIEVLKPIYDSPRILKSLELIALDRNRPEINHYSFDISNIRIAKGEASKKFFEIGNHNMIFREVDFEDNYKIGGFDFNLYRDSAEREFQKSLYGEIRQTVESPRYTNITTINELNAALGSNQGLNADINFDVGLGNFILEFNLYDSSYLLGMNSSSSIVQSHVNIYNKSTDDIYIQLIEDPKAKELEIFDTENIIDDKNFLILLHVKVQDGINIEDILDVSSLQITLRGKKELDVQRKNVVYKGENQYEIEAEILNNIINDGEYRIEVSFKTNLNDNQNKISRNVYVYLDDVFNWNLRRLERVYKNGFGNAQIENTVGSYLNINNLSEVKAYYSYRNINSSNWEEKQAQRINDKFFIELFNLQEGTYEIIFNIESILQEKRSSDPVVFSIESEKPIIANEALINDINNRNFNKIAYDTNNDRFGFNQIRILDNERLFRVQFRKNEDIFTIHPENTNVYNITIDNLLNNLNNNFTYDDGDSFSLDIRAVDINSNRLINEKSGEFSREIQVFRDNTPPHDLEIKNVASLITRNSNKNIDIFVYDNVAVNEVEIVSLINEETNHQFNLSGQKFNQLGNQFENEDWRFTLPYTPANFPEVEGDYNLIIKATDLAGNQTTFDATPLHLRIDNKNPVVNFIVNNIDSVNGLLYNNKYYFRDNSLIDSIEWNISDYTIDATQGQVSFSHGSYLLNLIGVEKETGTASLSSIGINSEGEYVVKLIAIDQANLETVVERTIVYDNTSPIISIARYQGGDLIQDTSSGSPIINEISLDTINVTINYENLTPITNNGIIISYGGQPINNFNHNQNTKVITFDNINVPDYGEHKTIRINLTDILGKTSQSYEYKIQKPEN